MPIDVLCQPDPRLWPFPSAEVWPRGQMPLALQPRRFREQLGLPIDRPVVMSGHQAAFWHGGIAAKYIAASSFAAQHNAAAAWIVVEQDPEDFSTLQLPVVGADGHLAVRPWQLAPKAIAEQVRAGVPPCLIPAFDPSSDAHALLRSGEQWASASVPAALETTRAAMNLARQGLTGAGTASRQISAATAAILQPLCQEPVIHVLAQSMHSTDLFVQFVATMLADPVACAVAYNQAVDHFPGARLTKLVCEPDKSRVELPLWQLDATTGLRKRVFAHSASAIQPTQLAPRALLMTALLRCFACDLFIHGKGGGTTLSDQPTGYDAAMEHWIHAWQGLKPSPAVVVSANLYLDIPGLGTLKSADIHRAVWLAQHARHSPAALGDQALEHRKRDLAVRIASLARDPAQAATRVALYREMHGLLDSARTSHADRLTGLAAEAAALKAKASDVAIASDRTYSVALFDQTQLGSLDAAVNSRLA